MDSIRRTIPRSAHRSGRQPVPPGQQTTQRTTQLNSSQRYIPGFTPGLSKGGFTPGVAIGGGFGVDAGAAVDGSPVPVRSADVIERSRSCSTGCAAPQTCIRWLHGIGGREAVAVSGSGSGNFDALSIFSVWTEDGGLTQRLDRQLAHAGKVSAIDVGSEGLVSVGSSRGTISAFRADGWETCELAEVGSVADMRGRAGGDVEPVVGVVSLGAGQVCAAGEYGSVVVVSVEAGERTGGVPPYGEQFDAVGLQALATVDEAAMTVAGAGMNAVTVWDVRNGATVSRFTHPVREPATAVTVDPSQPHFVIAGFRSGEVCAWDRRAGDSETPVSRAAVHDGPVWDVRVVSCNRPGRLVSCGEDGMAVVVDYATAVARSGNESWIGSGEFWRATVGNGEVRSLIGRDKVGLGVNGVDAHSSAELFAYASDSAEVGFGTLGY